LAAVEALFKSATEGFGGVDIVVINAGAVYDRRHVEASQPSDWLATLEVNLIGAYYCAFQSSPDAEVGRYLCTVGKELYRTSFNPRPTLRSGATV
jgi:NAD(P)-dependent dehydrogenase (short-subunit alcohol dehydrogenase family)